MSGRWKSERRADSPPRSIIELTKVGAIEHHYSGEGCTPAKASNRAEQLIKEVERDGA